MDEKRTINYRGILLMLVAGLLSIVIALDNPFSWQMWGMLGMVFIGLCHFIASLHVHGKWMEEQEKKEAEKADS